MTDSNAYAADRSGPWQWRSCTLTGEKPSGFRSVDGGERVGTPYREHTVYWSETDRDGERSSATFDWHPRYPSGCRIEPTMSDECTAQDVI